jgi:hypothetical protein
MICDSRIDALEERRQPMQDRGGLVFLVALVADRRERMGRDVVGLEEFFGPARFREALDFLGLDCAMRSRAMEITSLSVAASQASLITGGIVASRAKADGSTCVKPWRIGMQFVRMRVCRGGNRNVRWSCLRKVFR